MNNTGQIVKSKSHTNFTTIPNKILKDDSISMQAKGLFAYLMSLPEDWVIFKTELPNHFTNGLAAIRTAFKELEDSNYILSVDIRDSKGRFVGKNYIVYDYPICDYPISGNPICDKPISGNQTLLIKDTTNKRLKQTKEGNRPKKDSYTSDQSFLNYIQYINKKKNSDHRVTKPIYNKFINLKKIYNTSQIALAIDNAFIDKYHISEGFKYLTPEFFTRENIIDKFVNVKIQGNQVNGFYTP